LQHTHLHPTSRWFTGVGALRLALILALLGNLAMVPIRVRAAVCTASGPVSGIYTITLCFVNPLDVTAVSGPTTVAVSPTVTGSSPGTRRLVFYLDGQYMLTDYESPYTFELRTDHFVDGSHTLAVEALMRDGFTSQQALITLSFDNGVSQPPVNGNTFTPSSGTTPPAGQPFVLSAAGDGASGEANAGNVTDLIASWNPNMMLYLGDVYEKGTPTEFSNWYGTGTNFYARFRPFTNPTIGNHEYENGQAPGYFDYWDNVPNYYSYNAAGWHFISLNSVTESGQAPPGSAQYQWLVQDLNTNSAACTIAYFHHPVYNVGPEGDTPRMNAIWALLAQHGVDLVLTGHDHNYQRWMPLDDKGSVDPAGMTQFVVGTGGHGIQNFIRSDDRLAKGFDTAPYAFGALRLELNQDGAAYQFINIQGLTLDSGAVACSGAPPDTTPPSTPTGLIATAHSTTRVDLTWTGSTDNVGSIGYDIYRDGNLLVTTDAATSYTDVTLASDTTYNYQVRARDAAGNLSALSAVAVVKTDTLLFSDGFESGDLSSWTGGSGLVIQQQEHFVGVYAARGVSTGNATYAYTDLTAPQKDLYYRIRFKILSRDSNATYVQRFRTAANASLLGVFINGGGMLGYRNDVTGVSTMSATSVSSGAWHELQTHVHINGANGETEVWLDGTPVSALAQQQSLGATAIGRIQIGENALGHVYDLAFDDVVVDNNFIALNDIGSPSVVLTAPAADASVRGTVTLAADASDDVAVDRVEFFINGIIAGTDYLPPYAIAWNSITRGDGPIAIRARVIDTSTNVTFSASRTIIVDNAAPDTTIDSGPAGSANGSAAAFTFSANEPDATFDCALDAGDLVDCTSSQSYSDLAAGAHTFQVVATDAAGNTDPTPAQRIWTVRSGKSIVWLPTLRR
jgi:chitodextrinase